MFRSICVVLSLIFSVGFVHGFSFPATKSCEGLSTSALGVVSRSQFLSTAAAAATLVAIQQPAYAAEKIDPALKGTKADPEYQTCVSQCLYECTKPKVESKTRAECIPECKQKCATTKQQLMTGTPMKSS